jgi:hypothetical protein
LADRLQERYGCRTRRVGLDLEFEISHALKDGTLDHKARAEALWPADFPAVAASAELFLTRVLVDRILPAFNQLAGTAYRGGWSGGVVCFSRSCPAKYDTKTCEALWKGSIIYRGWNRLIVALVLEL